MARLGRTGRMVKWAGLLLSLLMVAAWAVSVPWRWMYDAQHVSAWLDTGCVIVLWARQMPPRKWARGWRVVRRTQRWWYWWPEIQHVLGSCDLILPLWIPFLVVLVPTAYLGWTDRRTPPGHCQKCGYNLTGNVSGICPECGGKV